MTDDSPFALAFVNANKQIRVTQTTLCVCIYIYIQVYTHTYVHMCYYVCVDLDRHIGRLIFFRFEATWMMS